MRIRRLGTTLEQNVGFEPWRARFIHERDELVIGDTTGVLAVLNLKGEIVQEYSIVEEDHIVAIELQGSPSQLLVGTIHNGVYLVDRFSHSIQRLSNLPIQTAYDIAVALPQEWIAVVGDGIFIRQEHYAPFVGVRNGLVPNPMSVAFSGDASLFAVGGSTERDDDARLVLFETVQLKPFQMFRFGDYPVSIDRLKFSFDGQWIGAGGYERLYILGRQNRSFSIAYEIETAGFVTALGFSRDGRWLVWGTETGQIGICYLSTGEIVDYDVGGSVLDLSFSSETCICVFASEEIEKKQRYIVKFVCLQHQ